MKQATKLSRRIILIQAAACTGLVAAASSARAAAHVEESDENAVALGYKHDSANVDGKKWPQHKADQHCKGCQFWQGAATDEWAGCSMFGRKHINAKGWCMAWKKI